MGFRGTHNKWLTCERITHSQRPPPAPRGARGAAPGGGGAGQGGVAPGGGRGTAANPNTAEMIQPFGLAFHEGYLYVGNTNSIVRYKYASGDTKASGAP